MNYTIDNSPFDDLKTYYDSTLNTDKTTYTSSNDEPTPMDCVAEMMSKVPDELWSRDHLAILDPCCGNGNFGLQAFHELSLRGRKTREIVEQILEFGDINEARLNNVRRIFCGDVYKLQLANRDFLKGEDNGTLQSECLQEGLQSDKQYDLIMANPPYAQLMADGSRASKNHNMVKSFIDTALRRLKPNGYILFITPDNWMSYADRNMLIGELTSKQIVHLDIGSAKKHFKKIGSSFTWYVVQNCPAYKDMTVSGIWKKTAYTSKVESTPRRYIPLVYNCTIQGILAKTVDNDSLPKFGVQTSSDLHKYTKASLIRVDKCDVYKYKLIHTPSQTVYASRPHKFQDGYKVFLSTTDKYGVKVDCCGMTQSIAFIICKDEQEAIQIASVLEHPLYRFINNICRWGNFNNVRILQRFPVPSNNADIYGSFGITAAEQEYIDKTV